MGRVVIVMMVCACLAASAAADVYVKEVGCSPQVSMTVWSSGYSGGTQVGVYNLQIDLDGAPGGPVKTVASFCVDVWDVNPNNYAAYEVKGLAQSPDPQAGPMGHERAGYLATLLDTYWNDAYLVTGLTAVEMNARAAALQTAAWEIVDEGNTSGGTVDPLAANWDARKDSADRGNFYVSDNAVADIANDMLDFVRNAEPSAYGGYACLSSHFNDEGLALGKWQDYVIRVPVPGAVLLGLLGLGAAGLRFRRSV